MDDDFNTAGAIGVMHADGRRDPLVTSSVRGWKPTPHRIRLIARRRRWRWALRKPLGSCLALFRQGSSGLRR